MAEGNSREHPYSVSYVNSSLSTMFQKWAPIWVEGEIAQLNLYPSPRYSYLTLRDVEQQAALDVVLPPQVTRTATLSEGDRITLQGKFSLFSRTGKLSLMASAVQYSGEGAFLAQIQHRRERLAAEGLFDEDRKKPLPFLPRTIALITGKDSAAERDVCRVASDRWPHVHFEIHYALMQGDRCVPTVIEQLEKVDSSPHIDLIIIARGGGSLEDLLPFSDETLVRAVAAAQTPVISAIGHEPDRPILDDVADMRAATPTDAAKRAVPDMAEQQRFLSEYAERNRLALRGWLERQREGLHHYRSRPSLQAPHSIVAERFRDYDALRETLRTAITTTLSQARTELTHLQATLGALGPTETLLRGYSLVHVRDREGNVSVLTHISQAPPGSELRVRTSDGTIIAAVLGSRPAPTSTASTPAPSSSD